MAFDLASMLGGLGMKSNPGTMMSVLGMGNVGDPSMTQAATGMAAPGTMPAGMGNPQLNFPGGPQMPGQGVQMPMAGAEMSQTPMASILANMQNPQMQQALLRAGPMMAAMGQQQQQPQQMPPGALPIAGAMNGGPLQRGPMQGYMAQGGGVAPRRIVSR